MSLSETESIDVDLIVEAMYRVAADPERWVELIDALDGQPAYDDAPKAARRGLAHSQEVARLVSARTPPEPPPSVQGFGWLLLSASGRVVAVNAQARAVLGEHLDAIDPGARLEFGDPDNLEALELALRAARAGGDQVVLKLERKGADRHDFCYLAPVRNLGDVAVLSGLPVQAAEAGFALLFPAVEDTARLIGSIGRNFGLTPAEQRLAADLRYGRTLKEISDSANVSINTLRNQLRAIFDKMGLNRQSDLIRALTELTQVAGVVQGIDPSRFSPAPATKYHHLADGRRLAYREYGVPDGTAVLSYHEGLGSSLLPPGAQALASDLGLRIVSVERPGFGRSDPHPEYSFAAVAADVVALCDALDLQDIRLSAFLSGAPSAIETAIQLGSRAHSLLICSGRPPRPSGRGSSLNDRFRARLEANPWVAETLYSILSLRLTTSFVARLMATGATNSPGDQAFAAANPWAVDYVTAYVGESLAVSSRGVADELRAFRRAGNATPAGLNCPVTLWYGDQDGFVPLKDMRDFLGDRPVSVRVFPGLGHTLGLRQWEKMMRHVAG